MSKRNHTWRFSTVGGVKRVNLDSGADLVNLSSLDPKLWTALSCPVSGLEIDQKTLELVDTDKDGQIRVPEVIGAVDWVTAILKNPDDLVAQNPIFSLSSINDETDLGKTLLASAKIILTILGKENAESITVEDTSDTQKIFSALRFNGDGIITEDTVEDKDLAILVNEIMSCVGSLPDRSGKQGISAELLQLFIEDCEKYVAWYDKLISGPTNIRPLGLETEEGYQNYCSVKAKMEDYFIRCRLAAFDPSSTEMLNLQTSQIESITTRNFSSCLEEIAAYPLANIEAGKALSLVHGINPAWEIAVTKFRSLTVHKLFPGNEQLNESEWSAVNTAFAPYAQWKSEKEGSRIDPIGDYRAREILIGNYKEKLLALIEQDKSLESECNGIIHVDKLVRYHRDLFTLLKNFVTFFDFYSVGVKAVFQAGTLYIDQRSCDLCIKVSDMVKHNTMVSYSGMYLLYCDCVSRATNEKIKIVAALTNGDIDNLVVGRNALFYDRKGLDWDATVVKIVENPISIRQAFFSPYRKISRFIEAQINKVASAEDEKVSAITTKHIEGVHSKEEEAKAKKPAAPPFDVGKFVGIFAAIGLAFGAIGSVLAAVVAGFLGLIWWKMPIAFAGLLLLISGPSMIIAFLKLRKRNLAPILDANGWAINARVTLNIPFGNSLTLLAVLPKGAKINLNDPFTPKKTNLLPILISIAVVAGVALYLLRRYGYIHLF